MHARTFHAQRAFDLAVRFAEELGALRFGSDRFALVLRAPDGPSTGGGVQARQAILLTGKSGAWVCGWVNVVEARCELESFGRLRPRGRGPARPDFEVYESALQQVEIFFRQLGLEPRTRLEAPSSSGGAQTGMSKVVLRALFRPTPLAPTVLGLSAGVVLARWLLGS